MSASNRPSRHRLRSRLFLCLALFGAGVAAANGGTITVTSTADDISPGTLRDALVHAVDGDVIELPVGAVFQMGTVFDDAANFMGPTATPMITAGIIIEANGSRLERRADSPSFRAFAVGPSGSLTIRNAHIKGFAAQGGRGGDEGGGGGMGAGGAIFVHGGALTVESSTFEGNTASGGAGGRFSGFSSGGGGGGLSGRGGGGSRGGGGGGGSRGDGGHGNVNPAGGGGGGGGTLGFFGSGAESNSIYGGVGGHDCGGQGGDYPDVTGADAPCPGGGGGGGSTMTRGGAGSYGGGGGGGPYAFADGGAGGFGGGGGAGGRSGGDGGFGGGGGAGFSTGGGRDAAGFGGAGGELSGGGGAGLGGAIFNDGGAVTIVNTTLTANAVAGGPGGSTTQQTNGSLGNSGAGAGGAIFSRNGSLTVLNATIAGNATSQTAGGIFVQADGAATSFTLRNTIIANNAADECLLAGNAIHDGSGNLIVQNYDCPGVVSVTDPQLGSLQSNPPGGTPTLAIGAGSSALDAGDDDSCRPTDQRGVARPQSAHCDIGAFEASQPVARCQDRTVSADAACMADASVDDGSYDPAGIPVTMSQDPPGPYPRGATSVTLTATNGFGAHSSCTATVTVIDTTPPVVTVKPTINVLLNNHTYKRFTVLDLVESVQDNCSPLTVVDSVISRATSDEPDDARGSGDGSTTNDIWIAPSCKWVALQQERDGGKDGRVYVSTIGVKDADGNIGTARSIVAVPLSSNQMPAVDSGIAFAVDGCSP